MPESQPRDDAATSGRISAAHSISSAFPSAVPDQRAQDGDRLPRRAADDALEHTRWWVKRPHLAAPNQVRPTHYTVALFLESAAQQVDAGEHGEHEPAGGQLIAPSGSRSESRLDCPAA